MRVTTRDRQVLSEVLLSKTVTRQHIIELGYFSSVSRCNLRLLSLRQAGLLMQRAELAGAKLIAPLYVCTKRAGRLIAPDLGLSEAEALANCGTALSDLTLRHSLRCTELRLLFKAERNEPFAMLTSWAHELLCHHEFVGPSGRGVTMKPDALATVGTGAELHHIFIEVDLGNCSLPRFNHKVNRYSYYHTSGAFADTYGSDHFSVLTVTTDDRRLENLVRQTKGHPQFIFTTWRRIAASGLSGSIYSTPDDSSNTLAALLGRTRKKQ